ncbi:hypothetical protein Agub_g6636 [Astrephomene gubernaculifera]|uniref:Uncharacterized protein n=1 Tax=Astrephomene gubernaculifera TaxID=47775 RepID=A0AAD3DP51_9CHLO|nr:hypothetical protein Agub_g6636 [Astrephomene gubernaculifera]
MFGVARVVRPAVAVAAGAAAASATQGPAHARAPPAQGAVRQAPHPPAYNKLVDRDTEGWVLAELKDEVVLFQPFDSHEVDDAANTVMELWTGRPATYSQPIITEPGEDEDSSSASSGRSTSSGGSDGRLADAVIEAAACASAEAVLRGERREREELEALMTITTRMLRRPGLQREVVMAMIEDAEVAQLMMRQCGDLDRYLLAAGIPNPQLLPAPSDDTSTTSSSEPAAPAAASAAPSAAPGGGPTLVSRVAGAVASALERAGDALSSLGAWLRRRAEELIAGLQQQGAEEEVEGASSSGGRGGGAGGKRRTDQVLGGVMVLAVAVVCVAVIKKPLVLRALARRG